MIQFGNGTPICRLGKRISDLTSYFRYIHKAQGGNGKTLGGGRSRRNLRPGDWVFWCSVRPSPTVCWLQTERPLQGKGLEAKSMFALLLPSGAPGDSRSAQPPNSVLGRADLARRPSERSLQPTQPPVQPREHRSPSPWLSCISSIGDFVRATGASKSWKPSSHFPTQRSRTGCGLARLSGPAPWLL